jgi:hypothetical protein
MKTEVSTVTTKGQLDRTGLFGMLPKLIGRIASDGFRFFRSFNPTHKHFRLNATKIRRAKRLLHVDTETEAIERALDFIIAEHERNELVAAANDRFLRSGAEIRDVYGKLGDK